MHCKLITTENGHALPIDATLMAVLQWTKESQLEVRLAGDSIVIRSAGVHEAASIEQATQRMLKIHANVLRELAK